MPHFDNAQVDLSYKSLLYAWQNTSKANKYCHGDGSDLSWIPDDTFDAVFSFGSIFHVYNQTLMCRSYKEMVRIAKRGAKIYNGWSAEDEFPNLALYHCLRDTNVEKVEVLEELKTTFKGIKTFPTKWKGYADAAGVAWRAHHTHTHTHKQLDEGYLHQPRQTEVPPHASDIVLTPHY